MPPLGRSLLALSLALLVAGCAGPAVYGPSTGGAGYAETRIEANRFRVRFKGDTRTSRDEAETFALLRAAELTLAQGGGHFIVVDRDVIEDVQWLTTSPTIGFDEFGYSRRLPRGFGFSSSAVTARPIRRFEAMLEIVVAPGPKPVGDASAYDAAEVVANLGPTTARRP